MKTTFVAAVAGAALLVCCVPALAQSNETTAACNRAWLASDWPSTVAECESFVESRLMKRDRYDRDSQASGIPAQLASDSSTLAGLESLSAGEAEVRVSFAYGKLKRVNLAQKAKSDAFDYLNFAKWHVSDEPMQQKVEAILKLLRSDDFYKVGADSDVLSSL